MWVVGFFLFNCGKWPVAGKNFCLAWQNQQLFPDIFNQLLHTGVDVIAGEIGSADRACKETVAGKNDFICRAVKANSAGGMAGRMDDFKGQTVKIHCAFFFNYYISRQAV